MRASSSIDWDAAYERAYRDAYGVLRNRALAEDVAQEACIKAWVHLDTFAGRGSFAGWVRRIAHNLSLDALRGRRPIPSGLDPDELEGDDDPERTAFARQERNALHGCIAELPPQQRGIVLARFLDGMKGAEIALEANIREGTVWATLVHAYRNLRRCLEQHGIERGALQ